MKRNEAAVCGNCPYWKMDSRVATDDGVKPGKCRYNPPDSGYYASGYYASFSSHWCGKHPNFWEKLGDRIAGINDEALSEKDARGVFEKAIEVIDKRINSITNWLVVINNRKGMKDRLHEAKGRAARKDDNA